MRALARPWGRMHVQTDVTSKGVPAVLLNALGADLRMWNPTLPHFNLISIFLRLDFRGHGLSTLAPHPYTIADLAEDVLAALDDASIDRAIVIGCSVGGLVAQSLAIAAPDRVAALVLSNTAARLGSPETWRERIARIEGHGLPAVSDDIVLRWFGKGMRDRPDAALWRAMLERTPGAGYTALCAAIAKTDLTEAIGQISAPCLVVAGSEDVATPSADVQALAQAIPNARFRHLAGVGHLPAIEAPAVFAASVSDFIGELGDE